MKRTSVAVARIAPNQRAQGQPDEAAPERAGGPGERRLAPRSGARAEHSPDSIVENLRSRLAGSTAREHVVLDFLEDDLSEVRTALAAVAAYVANVEAALADGEPTQQRLLSLALGGKPADRIEELATAVASVRRRLAQVAARM
jgi:hypothetical protein